MAGKSQLALIAILLLAVLFRFLNYESRYGIGYDGSRDALVAFESARQLQLPLTGSFSSIGPITFGPLYYWYITFSTFVIPFRWAPWIAIGLSSVIMTFIMYYIGTLLINKNFGLLLSLLAALSPAQILSSMQLQQHALIGLLSSVALLLFLILSKNPSKSWAAYLWGFILGFAFNTHFQSAGLLTLPFLYALIFLRIRFILWFIVGFFTSMVPILIFELNNYWFNTRNILDYIFIGQYRIWTSNRWLAFAGTFFPEFWSYTTGLPIFIARTSMVALGFVSVYRLQHKSVSRKWLIIIASFLIQIVMLRYYRGEKFFGYLQFFHPYIFIFTGYILYTLINRWKNPIVGMAILTTSILLIFPQAKNNMNSDVFNVETAARMETLKQTYPNTKFSMYKCEDIYDSSRVQGLLVLLYMNKLYDVNGRKITIANPNCPIQEPRTLLNGLIDIDRIDTKSLDDLKLEPVTPWGVWDGTARWWFREQP